MFRLILNRVEINMLDQRNYKASSAPNFFLLAVFTLFTCVVLSQSDSCSYTVTGAIFDVNTKQPLSFAAIKVKGTTKGIYINEKGKFTLNGLCSAKATLIISSSEHKQFEYEVDISAERFVEIYLDSKVQDLQAIFVKAEKLKEEGTESISQVEVDEDGIKKAPTESLAGLLSEQQGVSLVSAGSNVQLPVIHGLYGNRILVLNKGLKHGFQNWGSDHAPEINISSAQSITVIKGATGVRFGPEAMGGTILVNPNSLSLKNPFNLEVGTGFQTNGFGGHALLKMEQGFKKWSYFANAKYFKIGDRRASNYLLTNSGMEEQCADLGIRYHHKKWDVRTLYSYVDQNLALLRSSIAESGTAFIQAVNSTEPFFIKPFSYDINSPNQLTQHQLGKAQINWRYSDQGMLSLMTGIQLNKREEYDVRRDIDLPIIDLDLITTDYQLTWHHPKFSKFDGLIGVQVFRQMNSNNPGTQTTPFIPNYLSNRYSVFVTESRKFKKTTLESGIRIDYESNVAAGRETNQNIFRDDFDFMNTTASLGYVCEVGKNGSFRMNLGTAWRTPNMAELFSFGQHGFKSSFGLLRHYWNENEELRTDKVIALNESTVAPERGFKFTNELQIKKKRHEHIITVYSHYIENYIFDRPIAVIGTIRGPMPVFIFDQTDAIFTGFDYSWRSSWSEQFSGVARMNYLWSWNVVRSETLINQPPATVSYKLNWNQGNFWNLNSSELSIKAGYTFTQFQAPRTISPEALVDGLVELKPESEIFDFKDAPDGYFLLNVSWNMDWNAFTVGVSANNLLNKSYRDYLNEMRYFADEPGRNILLTVRYRFKSKEK